MKTLDLDHIEREAAAIAGVDRSVARDAFSDNLRIAVESANAEAQLSEAGHRMAHEELVSSLARRLQTDRWFLEFPDVAAERIAQPLFLTGLPRSGTTYSQYLFDNDPRMRLLRTWETARPAPAHLLDARERRMRHAAADEDGEKLRAAVPGFDAMHLSDTSGPDECHRFLFDTMSAIGVFNCQNVPTHYRALLEQFDLDGAYHMHKKQLQLLQWNSSGRRWVLKYPNHLIAMDSIVRVHPDARFVMTHRDPVQTLASLCKLTLMFRRSRSDQVDPRVVGTQMKDFVRVHFERMMASRRDPTIDRRVVDVDYYRLVASPETAMREIYDRLGIEIPDSVRDAVAAWKQDNPPGKRGVHSYALQDFGLDADAVAEEYRRYVEAFDIPREAKAAERMA